MKTLFSLSNLAFVLIGSILAPAFDTLVQSFQLHSHPENGGCAAAQRRLLEEQILDSTVRFGIESWVYRPADEGYDIDYSSGHGTVFEGRYLVTHNHFGIPLSFEPGGDEGSYEIISLYDHNGRPVFKGSLSEFELVREAGEALVFAHPDEGFFEALGFHSAQFAAWDTVRLVKGTEVAQIDWDGDTTRVDWVRVKDVVLDNGTPRLVLDDGVLVGASGGGIFWQGVHVANNWLFQAKVGESGGTYDEVTTAALNLPDALEAE